MNLFAIGLILFGHLFLSYGEINPCCVQNNVPNDCHYICNDKESGDWLKELKCAYYRAKIFLCKAGGIDVISLFGEDFKKTVASRWELLSDSIKKSLSTVSDFRSASIDVLKGVHQDMLSALHTISGMTSSQFKGLMYRFKNFATSNLQKIMNRVDIDVIIANMKDLTTYVWDQSQLSTIAKATYRKFGYNVAAWTASQLRSIGKIIAGLPSSDFRKLTPNTFHESLSVLCDVKLSFQRKLNTLVPAKLLFGDISKWNSTSIVKMCNLIEVLTPEEILDLNSKEIISALSKIQTRSFTRVQREAFLKKLRETWGKISIWTVTNLKGVGQFVKEIDFEDIKELDRDKLKELIEEHGSDIWDDVQKSALLKHLLDQIGSPNQWPKNLFTKAVALLDGLSVQEFNNISRTLLVEALEYGKTVNWSAHQAEVLLKILMEENPDLTLLSKEDIVKMGSIIPAFLASDAGKLSKKALFFAFPQLRPVFGLGEPVLRYFIHVYKQESANGEIKSLGQFVRALTREEISQQQIQDLLGNLKELIDIDFDEAQVAELMLKLKQKLGNLNATDDRDDDVLQWGFQNLKSMGKVVLGFTRKELKDFPLHEIENSIEVLGKQSVWKRRMVLAMYKRIHEYWLASNITATNFSESDIEILGKFVQGISLDDLNKLDDNLKTIVIQMLGEYTGLPEDKLKSRAYFAFKHLKKLNGGKFTSTDLKLLGNLISGLPQSYLDQIDDRVLELNLPDVVNYVGESLDDLKHIVKKARDLFKESDVGKWTISQLKKLGKALKALDVNDIKALNKDTFEAIIDELGSYEWNEEQLLALMERAKAYWGNDISSWSQRVLPRLGSILNALNESDINKMSKEAFENIVGQFRKGVKLTKSVKTNLAKQFKKLILANNMTQLSVKLAKRFSHLLAGFSANDLKQLNITNVDFLDILGNGDDWSAEQLQALGEKAKSYLDGLSDKDAYLSLKNLIKGLRTEDISDIPTDAFKLAAGKFGKVTGLSKEQKKSLFNKAKESWGADVSKWTGALVSEAGQFFGGISKEDINKIHPDHVGYIPPSVVQSMDTSQVQAFTEDQLSEFNMEQADTLTSQQKNALTQPQLSALKSIEDEDPKDDDPFPKITGAASWYHVTPSVFLIGLFVNVYFFVW